MDFVLCSTDLYHLIDLVNIQQPRSSDMWCAHFKLVCPNCPTAAPMSGWRRNFQKAETFETKITCAVHMCRSHQFTLLIETWRCAAWHPVAGQRHKMATTDLLGNQVMEPQLVQHPLWFLCLSCWDLLMSASCCRFEVNCWIACFDSKGSQTHLLVCSQGWGGSLQGRAAFEREVLEIRSLGAQNQVLHFGSQLLAAELCPENTLERVAIPGILVGPIEELGKLGSVDFSSASNSSQQRPSPPALRILGNWATEPWWAMTKLLAQGSEAGPCVAQLWSSWISRGRISKSSIKDQVGAKCGLKKTIYSECTEHFSNLFSSKLQSRNSIVFCVFCSFSCHLLSLTRSILGWRLGCGGPEDWSLGFLSPQGLASTAKTSARSLWPKTRRPLAYDWRCLWIFEAWSHGLNDSAIDIFRRL